MKDARVRRTEARSGDMVDMFAGANGRKIDAVMIVS